MHAHDDDRVERKLPGKFSSDFYYSAGSGLNLNRLMDNKKSRLIKQDDNDEGH